MEDSSLNLIVTAAAGSMRDAESLLGKVLSVDVVSPEAVRVLLGVPDITKLSEFFDILSGGVCEKTLDYIARLSGEGTDFEQFTQGDVQYARMLLFLRLSPLSASMATEHLSDIQRDSAQKQAKLLTEKKIYYIIML